MKTNTSSRIIIGMHLVIGIVIIIIIISIINIIINAQVRQKIPTLEELFTLVQIMSVSVTNLWTNWYLLDKIHLFLAYLS
jgi:hypothetical protein